MSDFSSRSPEFLYVVVGAIILVTLASIGFSLLADGTIGGGPAGNPNVKLLAEIDRGDGEIRHQKKKLTGYLETISKETAKEKERLQALVNEAEIEILKDKISDLALLAEEEKAAIAKVEEEHQAYRKQARRFLWSAVEGRPLTAKDLSIEMPYTDPVITRVDATGVRIKHKAGVDLIPVRSLSPDFMEQLDLSVSEAKAATIELCLNDARLKASLKGPKPEQEAPSEADLEMAKQLAISEKQDRVLELTNLIEIAKQEIQRAQINHAHSSNRSVPGKLETWQQRERRYRGALKKYEKALSAEIQEALKLDPTFVPAGR